VAPAPWLPPGGGEAIVNVVDGTGHDDIDWDVKGIRAEREYITLPVERGPARRSASGHKNSRSRQRGRLLLAADAGYRAPFAASFLAVAGDVGARGDHAISPLPSSLTPTFNRSGSLPH
jgi:hypothetical protein